MRHRVPVLVGAALLLPALAVAVPAYGDVQAGAPLAFYAIQLWPSLGIGCGERRTTIDVARGGVPATSFGSVLNYWTISNSDCWAIPYATADAAEQAAQGSTTGSQWYVAQAIDAPHAIAEAAAAAAGIAATDDYLERLSSGVAATCSYLAAT
jgi:hypothetical protein